MRQLPPFVDTLVQRTDAIREGKPWAATRKDGSVCDDNMLMVCGDGRKGSVDLRLVGIAPIGRTLTDEAADRIAGIYHATKDRRYPAADGGWQERPGGFQEVFLDMGTPGGDAVITPDGVTLLDTDRVYGLLRRKLLERGVPDGVIAYGHDARTHDERRVQQAACRDGRILILITSTTKGGTGANIQNRMVAIHHLDAPWRPDEIEQRDGRGIRPGNLNDEIEVFWYAVEGSFAPYMWQALARKRAFIDQLFSGDIAREVDDVISEAAIDFAHMKAISTGMQLVMQLEEARAEVARLTTLATAHNSGQARLRRDLRDLRSRVTDLEAEAKALDAVAQSATGERKLVNYMTELSGDDAVADALQRGVREVSRYSNEVTLGTWRDTRLRLVTGKFEGGARVGFQISVNSSRTPVGWCAPLPFPRGARKPGQAAVLLAAVDDAIDTAAARAVEASHEAKYLLEQMEEVKGRIGAPFPHLSELADAVGRLERLEKRVQDELDVRSVADFGDVPLAA